MVYAWFNDLKASLQKNAAKFNNRKFKNACTAGIAAMAYADGECQPEEKKKVLGLIQNHALLQPYDPAELGKLFEENCAHAQNEFARLKLFSAIRDVKGDPDAADQVARICLIIANADGVFQDSEKVVFKEICQALGVSAEAYA